MFKRYLCQMSRCEADGIIYHKRQHSAPFFDGLQGWHYRMLAAIAETADPAVLRCAVPCWAGLLCCAVLGCAVLCWPAVDVAWSP